MLFLLLYRLSHGQDGLSSVRIVFAIAMRRAHNPIDFSACMMSHQISTKIGKKPKAKKNNKSHKL